MATLMVLYRKAADPAAFDRYYFDKHLPIAKRIPGLKRYTVNDGPVTGPDGAAYQLVAMLEFDSLESLQDGVFSPEGKAAAADVPNFAQAGVEMMVLETKTV